VNITTKGGTKKLHGALGDRYNDRNLNSVAYGSLPGLSDARRFYSASLGGPIVKDKTFFFFSYVLQHLADPVPNGQNNVLDNSFTGTWAPANFPNGVEVNNLWAPFPLGNATGGQSSFNHFVGVASTANDLYNVGPNDCEVPIYTGPFAFSGTRIPIPCTQPILDKVIQSQAPRVDGFQLDGRIDQYFRDGKDRVYGAYVLEPQVSDFLWYRPGFNTTTPGGTRYVNLNYTHLFSPSLLSQTSVSAVRFYNAYNGSPANTIPFFNWALNWPIAEAPTDYFGNTGPNNSKVHNYQLHEDVTWTHGRHNVKAGFLVAHMDTYSNSTGADSKGADNVSIEPFCGNACMINDIPFEYDLNATLSATTGMFRGHITGSQVLHFGGYVQDDWKVKSNLLVTLGLRWDDYGNPSSYGNGSLPWNNMISPAGASLQQNIENDNISSGPVSHAFSSSQDLNFQPRVGFAWTPFQNRKLTVHGGMGLYNDAMNLGGVVIGLADNTPSQLNLHFQLFSSLGDVDPRNMFGTNANAPAPYGRTYTHPQIITDGFDSHGEPCANVGCTSITTTQLSAVYPHLSPQKTAQYNFQVEQEFTHNLIVGVGYAGSFSWNQYVSGDYNTFPGDEIANGGNQCRLPVAGKPSCTPEWGGIYMATGAEKGNYNALMLTARQTYHRLSWQAAYTWAKTLAYGGNIGGTGVSSVSNIYDPQHYYGPVIGSVPHSFNGTVAYELPGRGLHNFTERAILGGWEISGIATAQSGTPFSFATSQPFSKSGSLDPTQGGDYLANGFNESLVNVGAGVKRKGYSRAQFKSGILGQGVTPADAVAAGMFSNPVGYGTVPVYSNQGFNSFVGPGYLGVDSALHKKVLLPWFGSDAGSTLTLGIEASNVLNRANLNMPGSTDLANSNNFAQSVAAYQARMYQVVGKFQF
jgi:hypothetical protein